MHYYEKRIIPRRPGLYDMGRLEDRRYLLLIRRRGENEEKSSRRRSDMAMGGMNALRLVVMSSAH